MICIGNEIGQLIKIGNSDIFLGNEANIYIYVNKQLIMCDEQAIAEISEDIFEDNYITREDRLIFDLWLMKNFDFLFVPFKLFKK